MNSMRSLLPWAALFLSCGPVGCDKPAAKPPDGALLPDYKTRGIVILDPNPQRPNFWDFDLVNYGDRPVHAFRLKNLDPLTVTIRSMQPSCGCVLPTLRSAGQPTVHGLLMADAPPFRLAPGAEAELELAIDTTMIEYMNQDKLVTVRLVCDSASTPYIGVEAHLKVVREFYGSPALLDLGEIPQGYDKRASGRIATDPPDAKAVILGVERVEGPFHASVDEEKIGERMSWVVAVDANTDAPLGFVRGKVVFKTSGSDGTGAGRPFEMPISGNVVPRIVARPAQLRLGQGTDSAVIAVECLVPGEKVEILAVHFEGPGPECAGDLTPVDPDGNRAAKWQVVLRLVSKNAGASVTRTAVLELDDPKLPVLRVPVTIDAH